MAPAGRGRRADCVPEAVTDTPSRWTGLRRLLVAALGVSLFTGACRDATLPFEAVDRIDESQSLPRQLTFSTGDDRSPAWTADGSTLLYGAQGFPPFVPAPGLLLEVPVSGGPADEVLPDLQFPNGPEQWFASPVPGAGALAWMELFGVRGENVCPETVVQCLPAGETDGVAPRLAELRLRVSGPGGAADAGSMLAVVVEGLEELPPEGGGSRFTVVNHPFQQLFHAERSAVFRPSWSPEGDRLVFSDGLVLRVWRPGDASSTPVPDTEDGVHAAWSPDGEWIAFTRLVRGPPRSVECQHFTPLGPVCTQERVEYAVLDRRVMLVRPDGSELRQVGPGDDPAWWPGTGRLLFRRDGEIWSSRPDGTDARVVDGTAGGREPAASPDGSVLAFARLDPQVMTHDIWLVSLGGTP